MIDGRTSSWKCIIHRSGHSERDGMLGLRGQIYPANFYPIPPHSLMFIWNILLEIEFGGDRREYESHSERRLQTRLFINMRDILRNLVPFALYTDIFLLSNEFDLNRLIVDNRSFLHTYVHAFVKFNLGTIPDCV